MGINPAPQPAPPVQPSQKRRSAPPPSAVRPGAPAVKSRAPGRDDPPTIVPSKPAQGPEKHIRIEASPADRARSQSKAASARQYWMNYYRTHDEDPDDVKE